MVRYIVFTICLWFHNSTQAQIANDSLQKLLKGTDAQIHFYTKNINFFTPKALASITYHLTILKSVNDYKYNNHSYYRKVRILDSSFLVLKLKANLVENDTSDVDRLLNKIDVVYKKREAEIIGLKIDILKLEKQNYHLRLDTLKLSQRYKKSLETISKIKTETKKLEKKIKYYEHGSYWGLSLGFNYFLNNPPNYYVKPDSTIGTLGTSNGLSFLISAIIGYKFNGKHSFVFNVPLGDFTQNSQNAIGLFNQKLAGGLGYGYHISGVSIIAIINISPYERLDPQLLNTIKVDADAYSKFNINDYPTSTAYSPSFTLGLSYNFLGKPVFNAVVAE